MSQQLKTQALVLGNTKYRETSLISRMFTEKYGFQSFIINNVRTGKSKIKSGLFQPMNLVELVFYDNHKSDLHRISEIKMHYPYKSIPFQIIKSSILIFLSEVLSKSLREEQVNEALFEFMRDALILFDAQEGHLADFHLRFLLKMASHLGLGMSSVHDLVEQLAQEAGVMVSDRQEHFLELLFNSDYGHDVGLNKTMRNELLLLIISYFKTHLSNFSTIKSLDILHEVLA